MARITICSGDITTLEVDAIVNAANNSLLGGAGVDGAIHRAAGPELLEHCKMLSGCDTGKAVITPGFNLKTQYIIHTVGPVWRGGAERESDLLARSYLSCLKLASQYGITSLALPAISCGVFGYPPDLACAVALGSIRLHSSGTDHPQHITLVCADETVLNAYRRLLDA